jgi:MFS family permease
MHASRVLKRNITLLALCQASMMTGQVMMFATAPFIGDALAPHRALATLPIAVQLGATLSMVIPAAYIMKHIGRRAGLMIGAVLGVMGSALAAYAIGIEHFGLYCAGLALTGFFNGFGTFYRFAATDLAGPELRGSAVSYVLAGGVIAAILGPSLARWTADALPQGLFSGSYLSLTFVYAATLVALLFVEIPRPTSAERAGRGRSIPRIARQPMFVLAVLAGTAASAVMNLVMTVTPLAMHERHFTFGDSAYVVQWHAVAMFAPSFVTPMLIARFGLLNVMVWGAMLGLLCILLNLVSINLWTTSLALVALGIGWNFLTVSASTMLTYTYVPDERAKTQAFNDFMILGTMTVTAFASAPLHDRFGWSLVNLGAAPALGLIALAATYLKAFRSGHHREGVPCIHG